MPISFSVVKRPNEITSLKRLFRAVLLGTAVRPLGQFTKRPKLPPLQQALLALMEGETPPGEPHEVSVLFLSYFEG